MHPTPIIRINDRVCRLDRLPTQGRQLRAALNPATTDYYFFVASCEGGHQFSTSLEAHNRAVAEYRV